MLYREGLLHHNSPVINLYEYYQGRSDNLPDIRHRPEEGSDNSIHYQFDEDGLLMSINRYEEKKRVRRDIYDSKGYLGKTQYLDPENGYVRKETYHRPDGSVCICRHYRFFKGRNLLSAIDLIDEAGEAIQTFASDHDFVAHWIRVLVKDDAFSILVVDNASTYYWALSKVNPENMAKVFMIHGSHLQHAQDHAEGRLTGKLSMRYQEILQNLDRQDAVVVNTSRQKQHIEDRFGRQNNLYVIPHLVELSCSQVAFMDRIPKSAILVAKYTKDNQQESLVRIFHQVVQRHPSAVLVLHGFGEREEAIKNLINELGMERNIYLKDTLDDVDEAYNRASLAVSVSRQEPYSFFILESIAHGCPVVSYDYDYGPGDMIDHGRNGCLIERDNEAEMAKAIIELFDNEMKLKAMSDASYIKAKHFKTDAIAGKWSRLIKTVYQSKFPVSQARVGL